MRLLLALLLFQATVNGPTRINGPTTINAGAGGGGTASFIQAIDAAGSLGATTVAVTFSSNVTAGNEIDCFVGWGAAITISTFQDGTGANFTLVDPDATNHYASYRLASTSGGASASTITVTFSGANSGDNATFACFEVHDTGGTFTLDAHTLNFQTGPVNGTNTVTTGSVTTTGKDVCVALASTVGGANGGFTAGTNVAWVDRHNPGNNFYLSENFIQSSSGSIAADWSATATGNMRTGIVCLKP